MPDRLEWNLADEDASLLAAADAIARDAPSRAGAGAGVGGHRARLRRFGPRFWLFYFFTLTLAAAAGFGMGRFAESRQAVYDEIERALALEALAQRTEDATLLAETLDPEAHRAWRSRMLRELLAFDGPPTGLSILDLEVLDEDEVRVRVAPRGSGAEGTSWLESPSSSAPDGAPIEDPDPDREREGADANGEPDGSGEAQLRRYRFVNGRWLHAPIEEARRR